MVLTDAPGRSLSDITNYQVEAQVAAMPKSDDLISRYRALILKFEGGEDFVADPELPAGFNNPAADLSTPVTQPFTR